MDIESAYEVAAECAALWMAKAVVATAQSVDDDPLSYDLESEEYATLYMAELAALVAARLPDAVRLELKGDTSLWEGLADSIAG